MKKAFFLIAALLLVAAVSHAQTEKGDQTLGLGLGYSYSNSSGISIDPVSSASTISGIKTVNFSIGPSYSYFIADKLDLGATFTYGAGSNTYPIAPEGQQKSTSNTFAGMIYLRKYFMFNNKIGLRAGPWVGGSSSTNKYTYPGTQTAYDTKSIEHDYDAGANLEMVFYPSKNLGFSASLANLNYTHSEIQNGPQGHSSGNDVNLALINNGLSLSVFYAFGGK